MAVTLIRAVILYFTVIFLIRLMGKRQIGELQPSELVVTILVSEIASIPMQDNSIPILNSVIALFVLVAFEIFSSALSLKSHKIRSYIQGHPVIVIRNGVIDYKALKKLRMTVNDLVSALRQKDVFDFSQISYAIFETNGKISVLLKPEYRNSTAADVERYPKDRVCRLPLSAMVRCLKTLRKMQATIQPISTKWCFQASFRLRKFS